MRDAAVWDRPPQAGGRKKGLIYAGFELEVTEADDGAGWFVDRNGDFIDGEDLAPLEREADREEPAERDVLRDLLAHESDEEIAARYGWALARLRARELWEVSCGEDVTVAIIDSGIASEAVAFPRTRIAGRRSFSLSREDDSAVDLEGHGTMVASALCATGSSVLGIAPCVSLLVGRIAGLDNGLLLKAISWAAASGAEVISMSVELFSYDGHIQETINELSARGISFVAPVGNSSVPNPNYVKYPASYRHVLSVGAVDARDLLYRQSASSSTLDLVAPGDSVRVATLEGGVSDVSGTSFAVPFVAGSLAILRSAERKSGREPGGLREERALIESARPLSRYRRNQVGNGALSPLDALRLV